MRAGIARFVFILSASIGCGAHPAQAPSPRPVALKSAAPAPPPVASAKPAFDVSAKFLEGDWSLGGLAKLHVANGIAVEAWGGDDFSERRELRLGRVSGRTFELEPDAQLRHPDARDGLDLSFARKARFVAVSPSVGVFTDWVYRGGVAAYRAGTVPPTLLGRYVLAESSKEYAALEVEPGAIRLTRRDAHQEETLRVVGVGEVAGASAAMMVRGEDMGGVLLILATDSGPLIELVDRQGTIFSSAVLNGPSASERSSRGSSLPDGQYSVEGFSASHLNGEVAISGKVWKFLGAAAFPQGFKDWTGTVVGQIGTELLHVHLTRPGEEGIAHLDVRPFQADASGSSWLVVSDREQGSVYLRGEAFLQRAGSGEALWSAAFGLDQDLELFCTETGRLPAPAHPLAIEQALQRVGERALSPIMRDFCTRALTDRSSVGMRGPFELALLRASRPMPTCPGVARLAELKSTF